MGSTVFSLLGHGLLPVGVGQGNLHSQLDLHFLVGCHAESEVQYNMVISIKIPR